MCEALNKPNAGNCDAVSSANSPLVLTNDAVGLKACHSVIKLRPSPRLPLNGDSCASLGKKLPAPPPKTNSGPSTAEPVSAEARDA